MSLETGLEENTGTDFRDDSIIFDGSQAYTDTIVFESTKTNDGILESRTGPQSFGDGNATTTSQSLASASSSTQYELPSSSNLPFHFNVPEYSASSELSLEHTSSSHAILGQYKEGE